MLCKPFETQEKHNLELVKNMKEQVKSLKNRVEEEGKIKEEKRVRSWARWIRTGS